MIIGALTIEVEPERVTADAASNGRKLTISARPFSYQQHLTCPDELETLAAYLQREAAAWRKERGQ
jgi:hypothetical protein